MQKNVGWFAFIAGCFIIWRITEGFWLPFVGMMLIIIGDGLTR